ncbi:cytochrome c oxidase assembly protein [Mesobacillus foraminis]|uniref:Putative membrane protein n=1 Tax=Mesobacillus foraminis TaxID=279826 RepID=A0A4V2RDS9_9BACI|nr:cytochrome c oxidase assembly protein [Mesobacillus foraminis]TCN25990.1 putative membrane protein [Mesobacillus foraminis]
MNHHEHHIHGGLIPFVHLVLGLFLILVIFFYLLAANRSSRKYKKWPIHRTLFWCLGVTCIGASIMGPVGEKAHTEFTWHMGGHLLLGMLAPFLLVLSAPVTLVLHTLPVRMARQLSCFLRRRLTHLVSSPLAASILNIGGLWVLYTTSLYGSMHQSVSLYLLVHVHIFLAGYLYTAAMIYIDPVSNRFSFGHRAAVLILSLAGHGILSKWIYANPPTGVPRAQAELGGMLMYYGGDAIELMIIFILCLQWYKSARPRTSMSVAYKG